MASKALATGPEAARSSRPLIQWAHIRSSRDMWWPDAGGLPSEMALVGIPWPSLLPFVRISTHPRALEHPLAIGAAWETVETRLDRPNVWIPVQTDRHQSILVPLFESAHASGNHVPDAHLAALAIERGLELQSVDRDFARYRGLRWRDPLSD